VITDGCGYRCVCLCLCVEAMPGGGRGGRRRRDKQAKMCVYLCASFLSASLLHMQIIVNLLNLILKFLAGRIRLRECDVMVGTSEFVVTACDWCCEFRAG
jgi:hypothetical protein